MPRRLFLFLLCLSAAMTGVASVAVGCGNSVTESEPLPTDGGGGHDAKTDHHVSGSGGTLPDSGHDALNEYVDPGCPDAGPPIYDYQCDPYNQFNGDCAPGEACYIYVNYPTDPCGQETYGSTCAPAGPGGQGDACGGATDCGAGFVCVVTGSGTQCVQLCSLKGTDGCTNGLVCQPIDVEGFGGCL